MQHSSHRLKSSHSVLQQKTLSSNNESLTLVCCHGGFIATGNFKRTKSILLQRCGSNRFFAMCPARVYQCFSAAKSEIDGYLPSLYKNKISFTHAFTSNAHILMQVPIDRFFVRFDISNLSCVVNDSSCIRVRQEID